MAQNGEVKELQIAPASEVYRPQLEAHLTLKEKSQQLADQINSPQTYQKAAKFLLELKTKLSGWREMIKPSVQSAHVAHKNIKAFENKVAKPLEDAEKIILKPALARYEIQAEAARQKEQEKFKQETGCHVELPSETKMPGISYRDKYSAEISDMQKFLVAVVQGVIPLGAIMPNWPVLNQAAESFKETLNWPGVKINKARIVSAGGNNAKAG